MVSELLREASGVKAGSPLVLWACICSYWANDQTFWLTMSIVRMVLKAGVKEGLKPSKYERRQHYLDPTVASLHSDGKYLQFRHEAVVRIRSTLVYNNTKVPTYS